MPKLLDVIKEMGLSHEDVIKILNESQSDTEIEESEEIQEKVSELVGILDDDEKSDEPDESEDKQPEMGETPEDITLTPEELEKRILDAVEEATKAKVGSPNKGKESDRPLDNVPVVKKNWFEEIV